MPGDPRNLHRHLKEAHAADLKAREEAATATAAAAESIRTAQEGESGAPPAPEA